jgi:hypothetical protein
MQTNRYSTSAIRQIEKTINQTDANIFKPILLADPPKGFEGFFGKGGDKKPNQTPKFQINFGGGGDKNSGGQNSGDRK